MFCKLAANLGFSVNWGLRTPPKTVCLDEVKAHGIKNKGIKFHISIQICSGMYYSLVGRIQLSNAIGNSLSRYFLQYSHAINITLVSNTMSTIHMLFHVKQYKYQSACKIRHVMVHKWINYWNCLMFKRFLLPIGIKKLVYMFHKIKTSFCSPQKRRSSSSTYHINVVKWSVFRN